MRIAFNPSTVEALIAPPNNKDITFDLRGHNIFARGVKFCGTDTNTWRDIKINNVSIDSNTLDLRDGDNTTLTNINGIVTINSTWRPVVDNLTSDSTTSSLSAKQGKVLKSLIDGKSDSGHSHDDRYLRLTGGWMSGDINFGDDNKIYWGRNSDSASISFKNDGDGDADSYMSFVTSDNGNEYFRWSHSSGSTNTEWMALRSDGLRVGGTKVSLEGHSHNDLYYTKTEVNNKLNGKSDTSHTHDDRYLKLTGGIVNGVVGINATGVCSNSVLTVGPQDKRINTGIVDRYGTMLQIVGTGKKNEGGVIGFHNPGLYSAIIGFVRDTNETGFIFDTDVDRNSWYVKARAFKGNLIGDADSVDGVHMDWSTNYTAGNYLAIWDNAGNCIRPIPKGSTSVGYATSAGNADTVDSKHASDFASSGHNHDGRYVRYYAVTTLDCNNLAVGLTSAGVSATNAAHTNHSAFLYISDVGTPFQIQIPDSSVPYIYKRYYSSGTWSGWFKLNAGYADSAGSATKLQTARNLWGNSFDGTADISGSIHIVSTGGSWNEGIRMHIASNSWCGLIMCGSDNTGTSGTSAKTWSIHNNDGKFYIAQNGSNSFTNGISCVNGTWAILSSGNVGIGTNSPSYKLHINGTLGVNNIATFNVNNSWLSPSVLLIGRLNDSKDASKAIIGVTDGNLHIDAYHGKLLYLNFYNRGEIRLGYQTGSYYISLDGSYYNGTVASASNADMLDGYHASELFTNLSNSNNGISITVGGTTKSVSNISVNYANSADRANYLSGHGVNPDNSHPGHGARVFYSWDTGCAGNSSSGYSNGITIGSHPSDTNYGFQIVQNMWDDRTYTRRYNGGWQSWKTLAWTSDIPTVTDYYWANVKVSASSNTQTQPSVNTIYANNWFRSQGDSGWYSESYGGGIWMNDSNWIRTYGGKSFYCDNLIYSSNSIRMSDILLEHTNEINSDSGIYLNFRNSSNINLCLGGGNVGIGTTAPSYKLDVNGDIWCRGALRVGSSATDNYIAFYGNTGDAPGSFVTSFIGEHLWGGDESTELLLMKFNDVGNGIDGITPYSSGPDRIRHIAHAHVFLIMTDSSLGDFATMAATTAVETKLDITRNRITASVPLYLQSDLHVNGALQFHVPEAHIGHDGSYSDPWGGLDANFKFGGVLAATHIYSNGGFHKYGGNENLLLRADGGVAAFNWAGLSGLPSWLWGGNDFNSYYVYNPSNFRVAYASSAGNADTLDGYHASSGNNKPWGTIPVITTLGFMEIGKDLEFHYDNTTGSDYSTALMCQGDYRNIVYLPSASGTLALTSYGGDYDHPIFLGYLNLDHGDDGTISSSFYCLGYSVSFTYTRGGNYCRIYIPDTSYQTFYIRAATASVNYSGGGMDTWTGYRRGDGAWWLHCYAYGSNEVRVKGFRLANDTNDSWWGGNPLWSSNGGANKITVCIFGYVTFK